MLYPIGSIYMSVNSTNPSQLFGGTWEQISGRFLYCTTTSKTTGGSTTTGSTTLTINQIPSHRHPGIYWSAGSAAMGLDAGGNNVYLQHNWTGYNGYVSTDKLVTGYTGGSQGHTHPQNLPPYFTVYCWYRVG
ncbi:MAG: phage baseplate protein [Candidatus Coprovivens sp.]